MQPTNRRQLFSKAVASVISKSLVRILTSLFKKLPRAGLEPALSYSPNWILSPTRLPIPPPRQTDFGFRKRNVGLSFMLIQKKSHVQFFFIFYSQKILHLRGLVYILQHPKYLLNQALIQQNFD